MIRHLLVVTCCVVAFSCGNVGSENGDGGTGGGSSSTGGGSSATGGGSGSTGGGTSNGGGTGSTGGGSGSTGGGVATGGGSGGGAGGVTWCDVQPVVQTVCGSCHGQVPNPGAPTLMTAAEFRASAPAGGTYLDRSIIRMGTTPVAGAMPPNVGGSAQQIALFSAWRSGGSPDCPSNTGGGAGTGGGVAGTGGGGGSVSTGGGTGAGGGGGTATVTCTSNSTWVLGNILGVYMNPGEACVSCHQSMGRGPVAGFMGTVYPSLHESKLCTAPLTAYQAGVTVEILDSSGAVAQTFSVNGTSDGNFYGGNVGMPSPYRARVKVNGTTTSEMATFQTSGDCNSCHTPLGANGAPGRVHY